MEHMTINEVTKTFNVTTRMLRYYDAIGLLPSTRKDDYAYRVYDEAAIKKLQQILTLRKLRIPLRKISKIFKDNEKAKVIEVFQESLNEVEEEVAALTIIRDILKMFVEKLNAIANTHIKLDVLDDAKIMSVVNTLSYSKNNLKEEFNIDDLDRASKKISKLTDKDVRIVYLPPSTVAASHYIGEDPEHHAAVIIDKFVIDNDLSNKKPDMRQYGFNHPNPTSKSNIHGYEYWVTIPDDMEVPPPLTKKYFKGGLYGAHMIAIGAFEEWDWLWAWAVNNKNYDAAFINDKGKCMNGLLEEHLNYRNNVSKFKNGVYDNIQLDLLIPIKEKVKK